MHPAGAAPLPLSLPRVFQHWPNHLAYAALIEVGLQVMDELEDPIGFWVATTCRWARLVEAPPRFLAPELAEAFRHTPSPHTPSPHTADSGM